MLLFPEIPEVAYEGWEETLVTDKPMFKRVLEWFEDNLDNINDMSDYLYKVEGVGEFSHEGPRFSTTCTYINKFTIRITCFEYYYCYKIYDITTKVTHLRDLAIPKGDQLDLIEYNRIIKGESKGVIEEVRYHMHKIDAHIRGVIASLKQHMET